MFRLLLILGLGWLAYRYASRLNSALRAQKPLPRNKRSDVIEAEYRDVTDDDEHSGKAS